MPSSTKSSTKNTTSTGNSRSSKKSNKTSKTPVVSPVQTETEVSTIEKVVETPEIVLDAPTEQNNSPATEAPKPVVNFWELRKKAQEAAEALKAANDAIEKATAEAATQKSQSKPQSKQIEKQAEKQVESNVETKPDESLEGFTKVQYKKKPFGKTAPKQSNPAASTKVDTKKKSKPTDSSVKAESKPVKPAYKPKFKPKEPSEDTKYYERKNQALISAQDKFIGECLSQLSPKTREDINNSLPYIINYRRTIVMKFEDDSVVSEVNGEKFEFSRSRFFDNRIFQDKVREKYDSLVPLGWIRFFPGRDENTYCIGVSKRR